MKLKINEFFTSIQGEGLLAGQPHFFLRLAGCNIKCDYCDTDTTIFTEYTATELIRIISEEREKKHFSYISITGGEPLLQTLQIRNLLEKMDRNYRILLETNSTLPENLHSVIDYIDIVSMDFKTHFHNKNLDLFREFYNISSDRCYIKIVFDSQDKTLIRQSIDNLRNIISEDTIVFLQPETPLRKEDIIFGQELVFNEKKMDLRLLPQIHPFLDIR